MVNFILPDWNDFVDADFDFENDRFSTATRQNRNEVYLHEILGNNNPFDGVLVSLAQIDKGKGFLGSNKDITVREGMRIPDNLRIIGDCGAFSYKDSDLPTIGSEQAAELYQRYGFDVGASVDHMVIPSIIKKGKVVALSETKMKARMQLTSNNALEFIEIVKEKNYQFTPMGSIQGITSTDYARIFSEYVKNGYRQIAVGALVPKTDEQIRDIIQAIGERYRSLPDVIRSDIRIHLFGVLRPKLFDEFEPNGVSSFDSASYFRKAWLRSDRNYLDYDGNDWYASIRVPQASLKKNIKQYEENGTSQDAAARLEQEVLTLLRAYDRAEAPIEETLQAVYTYDKLFNRTSEDGDNIREAYRATLEDKPWKKCNCPICQELGIHVVIFRGYNRNKRRGFHNTIVFNKYLKEYYSKEKKANV